MFGNSIRNTPEESKTTYPPCSKTSLEPCYSCLLHLLHSCLWISNNFNIVFDGLSFTSPNMFIVLGSIGNGGAVPSPPTPPRCLLYSRRCWPWLLGVRFVGHTNLSRCGCVMHTLNVDQPWQAHRTCLFSLTEFHIPFMLYIDQNQHTVSDGCTNCCQSRWLGIYVKYPRHARWPFQVTRSISQHTFFQVLGWTFDKAK